MSAHFVRKGWYHLGSRRAIANNAVPKNFMWGQPPPAVQSSAARTDPPRRVSKPRRCTALSSGAATLQTLQLLQQRLCHLAPVFSRQLLFRGRQIKRIDRHLSLGIDQGNFNIAFLLREARTD